jgi:aminoglycoside/choline kinase family phosphotransferase
MSLFRDAFISWPRERIDGWIALYHRRAIAAGLPVPREVGVLHRDVDWIGVQRHLKVLGIFARIRYRDLKPRYLEDAPRFIGYLAEAIPRLPELAPLGELLGRWGVFDVVGA